jgi:hypothetical protein
MKDFIIFLIVTAAAITLEGLYFEFFINRSVSTWASVFASMGAVVVLFLYMRYLFKLVVKLLKINNRP